MRRNGFRSVGFTTLCAVAGILAVSGTAGAAPILPAAGFQFDLSLADHGDGLLGPDYGLRVDALEPQTGGETYSMSTPPATATMSIFADGTANISGTLFHNATTNLYTVDFTLSGLDLTTSGYDYRWSAGSGTLTGPNLMPNPAILTGEQDGNGDAFVLAKDSHRLPACTPDPINPLGDDCVFVGRGWLLPPGSTDDFLFRAELPIVSTTTGIVPEPGLMLLLGAGLAGVALRRRR